MIYSQFLLACVASLSTFGLCAQAVTVVGSSTMKPLAESLSAAFAKAHPDTAIQVDGGGSSKGVQVAGKGEASIGMASRELKDAERVSFPDLQCHKVAIDGIAIVAHKSNGVADLTREQLVDIYLGKTTNWQQLGGVDLAIVPVSASVGHGSYESMLHYLQLECVSSTPTELTLKAKGKEGPTAVVKAVDGAKATLSQLLANKGAIGYLSAGLAQTTKAKGAAIKVVNLGGIAPSEENIHSGKYAWQVPLFLLTKGTPEGGAKRFVDFAQSEAGRQIIAAMNYLPPALKVAAPAK